MKNNTNVKRFKSYLLIAIGILLVGVGVYFFLMPNDIAAGGAYGLAVVLSSFINLEVGTIMLIVNIFLFAIAFLLIGPAFGAKTIVASLGTSGIVKVLEWIYPNQASLSGDIMLDLFCGIIISAVGIGIVFNQGASTGGTDILGKIINKFTGIDLGRAVLYADLAITLVAGIAYGSKIGLYSLFAVIINGIIIDFTIDGMNLSKEVTIVSQNTEPIVNFIHNDLVRTCTLYHAEGAYSKQDIKVIVTIIDRRSLVLLKNFLKENDPNAFVWIKNSSEVLGLGFKSILE